MIIKKLTDNFFITNGFRIQVIMSDDFNEEGRDVKIYYSDLYPKAKDNETVNTSRENFKEVLRVNGLTPYLKECYILDAEYNGLVTHSRSVRRIHSEYQADPKWIQYELYCKLITFSEGMFEYYMHNEDFDPQRFTMMIRELEDTVHG